MKQFRWMFSFALMLGLLVGLASCSKDDDTPAPTPKEDEPESEYYEINQKVDGYLSEYYLWNTEYKTLSRDFSENYKDFFEKNLKKMTTNTLDLKPYTGSDGLTYYALYSYIETLSNLTASSAKQSKVATGSALVDKELEYNFGFTGLTPVGLGSDATTTYVGFCVKGVFPGSSADKKGIKRGDFIVTMSNKDITRDNWEQYYYDLMLPESASTLSLGVCEYKNSAFTEEQSVSVSSAATYCNPVIYTKVDTIGDHRIGYLVYNSFEASFDEELYDVFKTFKSKNITDIVLDLRYNGGGYTISANLIGSCIAAENCRGKVFTSLRYNAERMKKRNNQREDENFYYPSYPNYDINLKDGGLGLTKVYVLVSGNTASASELVINSLRGIDVDVVLIGEQTEGKNVGMEYEEYEVDGTTYRVVPITFQSYNAKGYGDYQDGFTPNYVIDESDPNGTGKTFYVYRPYGSTDDPLYGKAVELITGATAGAKAAGIGRKQSNSLAATCLDAPTIRRPGSYGMLKQ